MKLKRLFPAFLLLGLGGAAALADRVIDGSTTWQDTINDAITDATAAGVFSGEVLRYDPHGSGAGINALRAGTQGVAPSSRDINPTEAADLRPRGATRKTSALDGLTVWQSLSDATGTATNDACNLTVAQIKNLFCGGNGMGQPGTGDGQCGGADRITTWNQINCGPAARGAINLYRRDDLSGTTQSFKDLTGCSAFCADVKQLGSQDDCQALTTSGYTDPVLGPQPVTQSACFGGLGTQSFVDPKNQGFLVNGIALTDTTVSDGTFPMARKLFWFEVPSQVSTPEAEFRDWVFGDRGDGQPRLNTYLSRHDFVTCLPNCPPDDPI